MITSIPISESLALRLQKLCDQAAELGLPNDMRIVGEQLFSRGLQEAEYDMSEAQLRRGK